MVTQATLSFESRTRDLLREIGMDLHQFASLVALYGITGAGRSTLADALRGMRNLDNEVTTRLEPILAELADFIRVLAPIRPSLKNAVEVYGWLEARRAGKLRIVVQQD